jgi:peptide/nickel transport system substrate-binding protein
LKIKSNLAVLHSASLVVLAALIVGCAQQPAAAPSAPKTEAPAAAATQEPTSTPAPTAAPEQVQSGGTLTVGFTEEPETLNPYISQLVTASNVNSAILESLLSYNEHGEIVPQLAESYSISADGLTYTFKLRQGVQWHDGKPFTAADVVATWKIIMDEKFAAFLTLGWDKIASIDTPDDFTVVMKTTEKFAPFLAYVGAGSITPKHLIDKGVDAFKQEYGRHPIGTGPFRFVKWESAQYIDLEKNTAYWGKAAQLDKIRIKLIPDDNTLMVQLGTGEVQLAGVSPVQYEEAKQLPNSNVILSNSNSWNHLDLKMIDHLQDPKVRQALDFATPRQDIVDKILNGLGVVAVADQLPDTPYFNPNLAPRPYDLEKATALLAEAGFTKNADGILEKDGKPLAIEIWIISGGQQDKQKQQVIAASWRKLGVKVDEREEDIKSIFGPNGYQFTNAMTAGMYSWFNGNDPDDMFYWHSSQIPPDPTGSGGNVQAFFNKFNFQEEIDQLTEAGAEEVDPAKRKEIYYKVQEVLQREVPVIFLYWDKSITVVPKNLSNVKPNPFTYTFWNVTEWALLK